MSEIFEKQNQIFLDKLREIYLDLGNTNNSIGRLKQGPSSQIKKSIVEIKHKLKELKKQRVKPGIKLKADKYQVEGDIEKKVKDLNIESILKKEAAALDRAIAKVSHAERFCNSALSIAKIELLNAELICLEVIRSKSELNEIIHQ